jgi:hypothetical protein
MAQITLNSTGVASSGALALQSNGTTTAVTIDTSQNVGIGTSSPSSFDSSWNKLVLGGGSGDVGQAFYSGSTSIGTISFARATTGTSSYAGLIRYLHTNDAMTFWTQAAEKMRIDSSGNVGIGTSSPSTKLDVVGTISTSAIYTSNRANAGSYTSGSGLELKIDGTTYLALRQPAAEVLAFYRGNGGTNETMRIDSSGNLLVGTTTSPTSGNGYFAVKGAGTYFSFGSQQNGGNSFVVFNSAGVGVYMPSGNTSWTGTSDERLKTDLVPITNGTNKVSSLRAVTGRFLTDEVGKSRAFLIAQDVQKVLPEAVTQLDENGTLGLSYTDVVPLLVAAIQEQQALITQLQADVAALKGASA